METTYCLVADLVGFSRIMANLDDPHRRERVQEWVDLVRACSRDAEIQPERLQFVSDTLFAGEEATGAGLRKLVTFARSLLDHGIPLSLPIRGGIAMGEAEWSDPFAYGPAIVDAYRLCELQKWIGVSCESALPHLSGLWSRTDGLIAYAVPMKTGNVHVRPAIVWDIPQATALTKLLTIRGLATEGETFQWPWVEIVQNTILFRLYLNLLPDESAVDAFQGFFPAHLMAKLLGHD